MGERNKMNEIQLANYHVQYLDVTKHWHPDSQPFAGGDALATALDEGWQITGPVIREDYWHSMRCVPIYHFTLTRDGETRHIPVISNPYVNRLVKQLNLEIIEQDASATA
ncbi:MAG: hypothetical protein D6712_12695 [Chloroflexi bacterium]|nr:MAG: hypothetical protein D6712_12695 [Chloroflexota bacterium]